MIELMKYFRILFLSIRISRERLKNFTEDHIQRLTANNPGGIFTPILTTVTNEYNAYYGDLASESVNIAVQEGKTVAMNESRDNLEKNISDNEKLVAYTYRNNHDFYEEFYPHGITEYYKVDLATFETITDRYKTVLASHSADFPLSFVSDFNSLQGIFVANRAAQLTAKGNVASERSDLSTTKPILCRQLTVNLLTIALQYVGDESKADVYFDQSILNAAFNESLRRVANDINPLEIHNLFDNTTQADVRFVLKNTGETNLVFGFVIDGTTAPANMTLTPGQEVSLTAAELGWTSAIKFLNVKNPDAMAGSYAVEKI